jgi:hypothetical protein
MLHGYFAAFTIGLLFILAPTIVAARSSLQYLHSAASIYGFTGGDHQAQLACDA